MAVDPYLSLIPNKAPGQNIIDSSSPPLETFEESSAGKHTSQDMKSCSDSGLIKSLPGDRPLAHKNPNNGTYHSEYLSDTTKDLKVKLNENYCQEKYLKKEEAFCKVEKTFHQVITSKTAKFKSENQGNVPNTCSIPTFSNKGFPTHCPARDSHLPDTQKHSIPTFSSPLHSTNYYKLSQISNSQIYLYEPKEASLPPNSKLPESNEPKKDSIVKTAPAKLPLNKISCRERKRIIASPSRPPSLTTSMKQWVSKTNFQLDPFREDDDCWFHPSPPHPRISAAGIARAYGKIQKRFNWQDRIGKHSLVLNFGIVSKLINFEMTNNQKDGFINHQWHLSHLCGNWTCLNPTHTTVEPGNVNISRNNCFSHRSGCLHAPQCMKDKKVSLSADGRLVEHTSFSNVLPYNQVLEYGDWSFQGLGSGEEIMDWDEYEDVQDLSHEFGEDAPHIAISEASLISSQ